jgi:hypothetical protein
MRLATSRYRSLSVAATVWGIVFAVVHFYWAAGGDGAIGSGGDSGLGASLYIGFIAVLGLLSAGVARGLSEPWGARVGWRRLRALARSGSIALAIGVAVGAGRWLADGSLGDDGAGGVVITAYFLLGAALFAALGWLPRAPVYGSERAEAVHIGAADATEGRARGHSDPAVEQGTAEDVRAMAG